MGQNSTTTAERICGSPEARPRRYLPLGLDVEGLRCLVVGGGRIGARKALTLSEAGADVTVVSPSISPRLRGPVEDGAILWKAREYSAEELDGFFLVVAATSDPAVNVQISRDAEARDLLACVVSPGRFSRVIFPATHAQDGITVAVHSDGMDCSRSRHVRDRIAHVLRAETSVRAELSVFGAKRTDLPADVFESLRRSFATAGPEAAPGTEAVFLSTCERWECYFLAASPRPVIRRILAQVHERCGFLPERYRPVLYTKSGDRALHHLLRLASGLDSRLQGETEITGQVRDAAARSLGSTSSPLRDVFGRVLRAQKRVRRSSALAAAGRGWPGATIALLERSLSTLASRRVSLVGCGRLSEAIAPRLLEKGATVLPFSRRAGTTGVAWCSRLGLAPRDLAELALSLPSTDALVLSATLSAQQGDALKARVRCADLVVVDLTGTPDSLLPEAGRAHCFGLDDVGNVPLSGADAAHVARAERLALEHVLRWHTDGERRSDGARTVTIGGRGSRLSLAQISEVIGLLRILLPRASFDVVTMDTPCDRDKATPLPAVRRDDFFTRDLDAALLEGGVDLAVHSAKDLPTRIWDGLCVAAVTPPFAPWECLVTRDHRSLAELPNGARVGTSSDRRRQAILRLRPGLVPADIRGNVPERLRQLDEGRYDALVLAAAGLIRLGVQDRITQVFARDEFRPAPGQGSLALVVREGDDLREVLERLDLGDKEAVPWAQERST